MRKALNSIPEGLHVTYRETIKNINQLGEDRKKLAYDVLAWIFSAARPLKPRELQEAVALEDDDTTIEEDFLTDERTLIDICGGLVAIDENSQTVRFVHYTVQEYFECNPTILDGAHAMIAQRCLQYLSLDCFDIDQEWDLQNEWLQIRIKENALYEYAARNWGYHTGFVQQDNRVLQKVRRFSSSGHRVQSALYLFFAPTMARSWVDLMIPTSLNILFVATELGLLHLTQFCIEKCNLPADSREHSLLQTPLTFAAMSGNVAVVRYLAERDDVDADSKDRWGRSPLWFASCFGNEAVVRFLAARDDVDVYLKDVYGSTPLDCAASEGHEAVARFLAGRDGVDADSTAITSLGCGA